MEEVGPAAVGLRIYRHYGASDWVHENKWLNPHIQIQWYVLDDLCSLLLHIDLVEIDREISHYKEVEVVAARGE